ncbi:hypothetical protein ACTMNU_12325, partial [Staphylococcus pseudintermedius]
MCLYFVRLLKPILTTLQESTSDVFAFIVKRFRVFRAPLQQKKTKRRRNRYTSVTLSNLIGKNDKRTSNRLSVDKIIKGMNDIADRLEENSQNNRN